MQHYSKEQLAQIAEQVKAISLDGLPVFQASIINAHNDESIALNDIRGSGVIYLRIEHSGTARNFPMYVEVEE